MSLLSSGGYSQTEEGNDGKSAFLPKEDVSPAKVLPDNESRIQAARERFLARKAKNELIIVELSALD